MSVLGQALPAFLAEVTAALVIIFGTWLIRHRRKIRLRCYTLLGTVGADGNPAQIVTTRRPGSVINVDAGGRRQRFELTDARLPDDTYAAEPMDLYA
ncbi:hypothetical protein [Streptomyces sp. NPDC020607]|uniref:hypothetical protein n=1 Tax=Streptomyces sp. NPDC020607 TaxID=3365082 RepID=UPI0037993711